MRENMDVFSYFPFNSGNDWKYYSKLLYNPKHADVKPVYEKEYRNDQKNYFSFNNLPSISKVFENTLFVFTVNLTDAFEQDLTQKTVLLV